MEQHLQDLIITLVVIAGLFLLYHYTWKDNNNNKGNGHAAC